MNSKWIFLEQLNQRQLKKVFRFKNFLTFPFPDSLFIFLFIHSILDDLEGAHSSYFQKPRTIRIRNRYKKFITSFESLPAGQNVIFSAQGSSVLDTLLQRHVCGNVAYRILHVSESNFRWDCLIPDFLPLGNIVARLSPPLNFSKGSRMSHRNPETKQNISFIKKTQS